MSNTFYNDPNSQVVSITDFSPGIYSYARGGLLSGANSTMFSISPSNAPLGAASFACRCVNKPGIGLVPFYASSVSIVGGPLTSGNSPAGHPWVNFIPVGMGTTKAGFNSVEGGLSNLVDLSNWPQADYMVLVLLGKDTFNNVYTFGYRYYSNDGVTPFNVSVGLWGPVSQPMVETANFSRSVQNMDATAKVPQALLWMGHTSGVFAGASSPFYMPANTGGANEVGALNVGGVGVAVYPHGSRIMTIKESAQSTDVPNLLAGNATQFQFTDPPTSTVQATLNAQINYFDPEEPSGVGGWGSVSTGELFILTQGQGAYVVSGDPLFPSSVQRLPAVRGTGNLKQRLTACAMGLVYSTDTDGVYAWNGGNTSQKISNQIPDNATLRYDLLPGQSGNQGAWIPYPFGAAGIRTFHDRINQYVFFPHNWILDDQNGSWWLAENPVVVDFGVWCNSAVSSTLMYGIPMGPFPATGNFNQVYLFDSATAANSWTWVSAPIRSQIPGLLPTLSMVEICASNPYNVDASITVKCQTPDSIRPSNPALGTSNTQGASTLTNNPQSVTFDIPANAISYRATQPLGFTETNLCVAITALGGSGGPAPILHELHLGFSSQQTSATNG